MSLFRTMPIIIEPTGSSHGQSRYLELSRALSDVKREQQMYHIESIEELTVSMMDEYANEEGEIIYRFSEH